MKTSPIISVVVPFFNEEETVRTMHRRLSTVLLAIESDYELVFVDDGSHDSTAAILDDLIRRDSHLVVITLSRNFGHQAAITAGIDQARGHAVIVMDGDGQDPPEVLDKFILMWRAGHEVVYAIRTKRKESLPKRIGYYCFYRLLAAISELNIPLDSGDFCLMDRKVVDALQALPERTRFVRGLRTFVGFRQVGLSYERAAREAGEAKYTFRKLVGLALDGLISFSSYPLHLVTYLGLTSAVAASLLLLWVIFDALLNVRTPRGWASTLVVVLFMGATQLICQGILGEYVRRIFIETKGRPPYIVRRVLVGTPAFSKSRSIDGTALGTTRSGQQEYA